MSRIENKKSDFPAAFESILRATELANFSMSSDIDVCRLLRTLAASKPNGNFLELGTGTGLSTSWILEGMDSSSTLVSLDNDSTFLNIAMRHLGSDTRLKIVNQDGGEWIEQNARQKFNFIFADTWHGKYLMLREVLAMLKVGGIYFIDDMLPQDNWPKGHFEKAERLAAELEKRSDFLVTKLNWGSGVMIAVKK